MAREWIRAFVVMLLINIASLSLFFLRLRLDSLFWWKMMRRVNFAFCLVLLATWNGFGSRKLLETSIEFLGPKVLLQHPKRPHYFLPNFRSSHPFSRIPYSHQECCEILQLELNKYLVFHSAQALPSRTITHVHKTKWRLAGFKTFNFNTLTSSWEDFGRTHLPFFGKSRRSSVLSIVSMRRTSSNWPSVSTTSTSRSHRCRCCCLLRAQKC